MRDLTKNISLINIKFENWDACMREHLMGIPKTSTVRRSEPGDIYLVRRLKDPNENYGVMGIWYVFEIEEAYPPYPWPGEWSYYIHMRPIIKFKTPFNEDMKRERKENGSLGGSESMQVEGLKGRPHLNLAIYSMTTSEKNKEILWNYLNAILLEKEKECNFGNFKFTKPVDDRLIHNFISELEIFIDKHLFPTDIYSNLAEGEYKKGQLTEEEIWKIFIKIFSTSESTKVASYKFALIHSIIENLENLTDDLKMNFDQLFLSFTIIYWKLVIRHKLYQISGNLLSSIYRILTKYLVAHPNSRLSYFNSINDNDKNDLIKEIANKCSRNVFGALFGDSEEYFYSFNLKKQLIQLNPLFREFLSKYKQIIRKLYYYEWLKFLERRNPNRKIEIDIFERL